MTVKLCNTQTPSKRKPRHGCTHSLRLQSGSNHGAPAENLERRLLESYNSRTASYTRFERAPNRIRRKAEIPKDKITPPADNIDVFSRWRQAKRR